MAFGLALSDARTEVIHIAALDGQTGSNQRHSPTRLNAILIRAYRALQSRAYQLGLPHGLANATGTLGSPLASEDFVSLDIPAAASEVVGVDVRNTTWEKLDPLTWEQRRDVQVINGGRVMCEGVLPKHGVGFWAQRLGASVSGADLTQGKLAIWPPGLSGKAYTLHYCSQVTALAGDTHVFLMHDGWEDWLLNKAAMGCCRRDTNKRTNYDTAKDEWLIADALLEAQAARAGRAGTISPTPYRGVNL